jgi:radical SAM superfamily enzyme YgiQ (UPF0313 family)
MEGEPLDLSAILIYPNTRDVALSSLGFLKVYGMLASRVAVADFSYLPDSGPSPVVSRRQSLLLGERTGREARSFDIMGFSVSYENDYVNVAKLLDMAGIEPLREKRQDTFPLVVVGGFTMFMNPRPLAPFADAIVVGEAEPVVDEFMSVVAEAKRSGLAKAQLLGRLAGLRGVLVPSVTVGDVERAVAGPESFAPEPSWFPASHDTHFGDMRLVEVGRGCGRGCLFCAAGCLYRPVRMRAASEILRQAEGARKVGLVGPAVADHPEFERILAELVEKGVKIGVSSLRADRITPRLAALLVAGGMKTATIAPEAGPEALRKRIGKNLTDEELLNGVGVLAEAGVPTIKLYFMIDLPGETDDDVRAIVDLVKRLAGVRRRSKLSVSVAPFVPKPGTPFESEEFADMVTLKQRAGLVKAVRSIKGCSLKVASVHGAWLEAALARADESVATLILEAARGGVNLRTHLRRSGYGEQ